MARFAIAALVAALALVQSSLAVLPDCPANSVLNLDLIDEVLSTCSCLPGFTTLSPITLDNSTANYTWFGGCTSVPCPENSSKILNANNETSCSCNTAYSGTIVWNPILESWGNTCTFSPCPSNSTYDPSTGVCTCSNFFKSTTGSVISWNNVSQSWLGTCAFVQCPANSVFDPATGTCVCKTFYKNNPASSKITWNSVTRSWSNSCLLASCPTNAKQTVNGASVTCSCNTGFSTTPAAVAITWNPTTQSFTNTCTRVACPTYSTLTIVSGSPTCLCNKFFDNTPAKSKITWDSVKQKWLNGCAVVKCPTYATQKIANAAGSVVTCTCNKFYIPTPKALAYDAVKRLWTNTCTLAPCPANAASPSAGKCVCKNGYKATGISFSTSTNKWTGSCTYVAPPVGASYNTKTAVATCGKFYAKKTLGWDSSKGVWVGTCALVPCPANSDRAVNGAWCTCRPGYPGTPAGVGLPQWDYTKQVYSGGCGTRAACSIANAAYNAKGLCACVDQYQGKITWTKTKWTGSCSLIPCTNVRKEWTQMTLAEQNLYLEAVSSLAGTSGYNSVLSSHWNMPTATNTYAHQTHGLYAWHRAYVFSYENALRNLGTKFRCVTVPYYDWSANGNSFISSTVMNAFGGSTTCLRKLGLQKNINFGYSSCVSRSLNSASSVPGSSSVYNSILTSSLSSLYSNLGSAHNAVHNCVGGTMAQLNSPLDPFFFMHHGFVDYQWWLYSVCKNDYGNGGLGTIPGFGYSPSAIARPERGMNGGRGYTYQLSKYALSAGFLSRCPNARSFTGSSSASSSSAGSSGTFNPLALAPLPGSQAGSASSGSSSGVQTLQGAQANGMLAFYNTLQASGNQTAALQAACRAENSVRIYNGPTAWAKMMCTSTAEYDSFLLDKGICTTFADSYLLPSYRASLVAADASCKKSMTTGR